MEGHKGRTALFTSILCVLRFLRSFVFESSAAARTDPSAGEIRQATPKPAASLPYKLPNSAVVSDMRLEKPHSLSYQPITRASAPSTTVVCVESKVHEAGQ